MSGAFKKAAKSHQKVHRERAQPAVRHHLGRLPKKKDYQERSRDYNAKQEILRKLERKALNRNPDEFYFNMISSRIREDGTHESVRANAAPVYTEEQLALMETQDLKYIRYKRSLERRKIERLQVSLQFVGSDTSDNDDIVVGQATATTAKASHQESSTTVDKTSQASSRSDSNKNTNNDNSRSSNKHIIFVDSVNEMKSFDPAKHFDTHPAFVERRHNRLRRRQISERLNRLKNQYSQDDLESAMMEQKERYDELKRRIERDRQLAIVEEKMLMKKHLNNEKRNPQRRKTLISRESATSAAVYRWAPMRNK